MRMYCGGASPRACVWPLVIARSCRRARALVHGGGREARETALWIGEVAAIRTSQARARHDEIVGSLSAGRDATHEVLRGARLCIARLRPHIPGLAGQARSTLHADAAILVDPFAAVTLFASCKRALFTFLFAAAFLVA